MKAYQIEVKCCNVYRSGGSLALSLVVWLLKRRNAAGIFSTSLTGLKRNLFSVQSICSICSA
jgi:hypothetical protein